MLRLVKGFSALYLASLLMQFGSCLLSTYLALRLSVEGVSEFWIGTLMAVNFLGLILGRVVGYRLIMRFGHMRAYVSCAALICVAVLTHTQSSWLPLWLVLRLVVGMAMMCLLMVLESWLNDCERERRGLVFSRYMIATFLGQMLGQLAMSFALELSEDVLILVAISFSLCLIPIATTDIPHPQPLPLLSIRALQFIRTQQQALGTLLVSGLLCGSLYGLAPIYAHNQGLSNAEVGQFMAIWIFAGLLAQAPLGWLSDRYSRAWLIRLNALLFSAAALPLAWWSDASFAGLLLTGFVMGALQFCLYPLGVALANDQTSSEQRLPLAGVLLATYAVGSCVGSLLAGALMARFGPAALFQFEFGCALLLAVLIRRKRTNVGVNVRVQRSGL